MQANPVHPVSEAGVRYFDGTIQFEQTDLASGGFGEFFGITRSWSNYAAYSTNSLGSSGMVIAQLPYLQQSFNTIIAISNATTARYFDFNFMTQTYTPRYFLKETLTHDVTNKEFVLTDTTGNRITWHDFDASLPVNKQGQFKKFIDPAGNETAVTSYTVDDRPAEILRSGTAGTDTTTESFVFTYVSSGVNAGEISNITQRVRLNSGAWNTVRSVDLSYYDGSGNDGNARDLKTAIIKDAGGAAIDTYYFRFYKAGEANGYEGGLQYAFSPRSYDRLKAVYADPTTATDAQVSAFADLYLEFNAAKYVTKATVQGAGGGAGGLGTYTYDYYVSEFADAHSAWSRKTVETLPDLSQNIVFTNFAGQVMLKSFKQGSNEWVTFFKYDDNGRLLWSANPSAVSGYSETYADLVNDQSGNYQYLRDSEGLIEIRTYYTTTDATSTTPGGVAGYYEKSEEARRNRQRDPPGPHAILHALRLRLDLHDSRDVHGLPQHQRHRRRNHQLRLHLVRHDHGRRIDRAHAADCRHHAERPRLGRHRDDFLRYLRPAHLDQGRRRLHPLRGVRHGDERRHQDDRGRQHRQHRRFHEQAGRLDDADRRRPAPDHAVRSGHFGPGDEDHQPGRQHRLHRLQGHRSRSACLPRLGHRHEHNHRADTSRARGPRRRLLRDAHHVGDARGHRRPADRRRSHLEPGNRGALAHEQCLAGHER